MASTRDRSVRLRRADIDALSRVQSTLLEVFEATSFDEWRQTVVRSVKALLGADIGTMIVPFADTPVFCEEATPRDRRDYRELIRPLDARWAMYKRHAELGVWARDDVWHRHLGAYLRSPYYNEFIVPGRYFDALGMTCVAGPPGSVVRESNSVTLMFHHANATGPTFGERGRTLLRLLHPALRAASARLEQQREHARDFTRVIDTLALGFLLVHPDGREIHRTAAYDAMLEDSGASELLSIRVREVVIATGHALGWRAARPQGDAHAFAHQSAGQGFTRDIVMPSGAFRITVTSAASLGSVGWGSSAPPLLVLLSRALVQPVTDVALRERFHLTKTQIQVARAVTAEASVSELAAQFGVSVHTTRRHLEAIRMKLGVNSMAGIAAVLRGERSREPSGR